jgi:predicted small secreted protein
MKPFRLLPLLLAVIALTVSACGGSGDDASSGGSGGGDASALIKDTFGAGHSISSGRVDATLDVDLKGWAVLSTPLDLHLNGPFQSNGGSKLPDFALDVDFGGTPPVTIGAVFAQGGGYLSLEGQAFDLGKSTYESFRKGYESAKKDSASKDKKNTTTLSALGVEPIRWLKDPKKVGEEDVAGTSTVHLTSGVDVPKLLTDLSTLLGKAKSVTSAGGAATGTAVPTQLSAQQRELIQKSVKSAKVDVWTGAKDHTLRKVSVRIQVAVPAALKDQANGLTTGHVDFMLSIAQLNQAQKISKPADARPISQLRSALAQSGLAGGDTSSSSAPSDTATTPTTTSTTPADATPADEGGTAATEPQGKYAACLAAAGTDLAKVQDCAQYLNK